ncbi:MAG: AbrB/MazE/SpoVT family DNA-binding domain-containing protein [Spirochaetes bacterium]|nr:AbrB/MazE/SpoVT family DNA-binding domain-containing protein [Spirochaetota bacterium]
MIIDQAQLENKELEFKVTNEGLLIHPKKKPREGWAKEFDKKSGESLSSEEQEWLDAFLTEDEKIE